MKLKRKLATEPPLYVHYGCGACAPLEWVNFDASPRLYLERLPAARFLFRVGYRLLFDATVRYGDVVAGLPIADSTAVGVYCSHVLEHLPRNSMPAALAETMRLLAPGGRFRLVVPDLMWRAQEYVEAAETGVATADTFIESCNLGVRVKPAGPFGLARRVLGNSAHLWMYDYLLLSALLEDAGFTAIRRCELGDSGDPMFDLVEDHGRFFEGEHRELAIEAFKPL